MKVNAWINFFGSAIIAGLAAGGAVLLVPGVEFSDPTVWHAAGAAGIAAALNHIRATPFPKH